MPISSRMPRKGYSAVSLPEDLLERVRQVIESERGGYSSIAEFVKEAIRLRLKELGFKEI
ncbi:MAG: ribbon-helix-helix domain-containing protein [Candidatus Geothermarchaeales archaeon]